MSRQPPGIPRRKRMRMILERDGEHCVWCRRPLTADDRLAAIEAALRRLDAAIERMAASAARAPT
jgi:hypothetical protein